MSFILLAALVLATLVPATAAPPRTGAPPPAFSGGANRAGAPFSCEDLGEEPWTLFGGPCPGQQRATSELRFGWEEDDGGSLDADDVEAAWDRAFADEREPAVEDRWADVEE